MPNESWQRRDTPTDNPASQLSGRPQIHRIHCPRPITLVRISYEQRQAKSGRHAREQAEPEDDKQPDLALLVDLQLPHRCHGQQQDGKIGDHVDGSRGDLRVALIYAGARQEGEIGLAHGFALENLDEGGGDVEGEICPQDNVERDKSRL